MSRSISWTAYYLTGKGSNTRRTVVSRGALRDVIADVIECGWYPKGYADDPLRVRMDAALRMPGCGFYHDGHPGCHLVIVESGSVPNYPDEDRDSTNSTLAHF